MRNLKRFGIILPFFIGVVFCACQPTPEDEIVVNKRDTEYIVHADFQKMELPDKLVLPIINKGKAFVTFQAEVVPSTATGYPVVRVSPGVFHTDQIQNMLNALLPADAKIYEAWDRTKEEFLWLMAEANQLDSENEDVRYYLDWLNKASENAPLSVQKVPAKISEALPEEYSNFYVEAAAGSAVSSVAFVRDGTSFTYTRDKEYLYTPFSWIEDGMPYETPEPRLSENEAEEKALQALRSLGIDFPVSAVFAEPVVIHRLPKTEWCGWIFHFSRTYSGINTIYDEGNLLLMRSPPSIGAPWPHEMIRIVMDEYGVFCFQWENPLAGVAVVAENIEIISLDEAAYRAQQQLLYMYAASTQDAEYIERMNITVEKAELMMGVLSVRNHKELGQTVPLWKFFYTLDTSSPDDKPQTFYLCISAIDGSYVDPIVTTQDIEDSIQKNQGQ